MKRWMNSVVWVVSALLLAGWMTAVWLRPDRFRVPAPVGLTGQAQGSIRAVAERVDAEWIRTWGDAGVEPVEEASPLIVARRLSLALTGSIPSLEEIRAIESMEPDERLEGWVMHLLRDRRTADYLAERWARVLVGVEDGPFIVYRRRRLVKWLADALRKNRPVDAWVRELITAEGIWTTRPEVNFVTATVDPDNDAEGPDEEKLAGRVSRAFLGVRMDCVQCHDDFFGDRWKQKDFHQLAAFFVGAEMSLTGVRDKEGRTYEYRYLRRPERELVPARVPFQEELLPAEGALRTRLAAWVTHPENRAFARTVVNRVWAQLFGQPLHQPIDDIPLDGPFPPGMEILTTDFVEHGYDVQRLIRVIAATRVFRLESRASEGMEPVTGRQEELFAAFPLTRLRPEQVAGALWQSARLRTVDADAPVLVRMIRYFQQQDFVGRYGDLGADEFEGYAGTIPQRLVMMNGELVRERTGDNIVMNAATRIGAVAPDDGTAVEAAFLAVLTRRPTPEEAAHFVDRLGMESGLKKAERMEDLYWTLLNSTEFSWNH
jgi:hypothetical protein